MGNGKNMTLYERYLELKGDSKNAPDGVARKLMREFQIIGMNKYYKELKKSREEWEACHANEESHQTKEG